VAVVRGRRRVRRRDDHAAVGVDVRAVHRLEARQPAGLGDLADDRPVGGVEREQPQIRARPVRVDEDVEAQC
jgi:hypothetical protein